MNHTTLISRQSGSSMIEVLVAMILLATALLSAVALQFATAKEQRSAQFSGRAAMLAEDLADRMRANSAAVTFSQTAYGLAPTTAATYDDQSALVSRQTLPAALPTNPTYDEVADWDMSSWRIAVRDTMPAGSAAIVTAAAQGQRTVVIAWVEPVVERTENGEPNLLPRDRSACPASISSPAGVRCYVLSFTL